MTFKPLPRRKISTVLKGVFTASIPYVVNNPDGFWTPPVYENQLWYKYDSDDCWCLSSVNQAEIILNSLLSGNQFSTEALNFFNSKGYIVNGTFQLSELFHEILCGNLNNGGTSQEAWQSFASRGFIPRSMLNYSQALAQADGTDQAFVTDYYNKNRVTSDMIALGLQFLKYVTIQNQGIFTDPTSLKVALRQAPLDLGIPIPYDAQGNCLWNVVNVPLITSGNPQHAITLLSMDTAGNMTIFDQYQPTPKILPAGYLICAAVQGVITPIQAPTVPVVTSTPSVAINWSQFFSNLVAWLTGKPLPYPRQPIGHS